MPTKTDQQDKLELLKDILFPEEQQTLLDLSRRIDLLEKLLEDQKGLARKIGPLVDQKLIDYTQNIPSTLGPTITTTLKEQIKNNPTSVTEALAPVMGSLVRTYLLARIKHFLFWLGTPFRSIGKGLTAVGSWFGGVSEEALLERQLKQTHIEQLLLIEKKSGTLKASYAESKRIDAEILKELVLAIHGFVSNKANAGDQHLELIPFKGFQIHLQSFMSHYVAVVLPGKVTLSNTDKLQDIIFNFYYHFMEMNLDLLKEQGNSKEGKILIDQELFRKEMAACFGTKASKKIA